MASRADLTQVETCDKNMNIQGQDGTPYRNQDGVITLPKGEAQRVLEAGVPGVRPYRKLWSVGDYIDQMKREGRW